MAACDEILNGNLRERFAVDVYQAGAGISHNMNANEVSANRAIELLLNDRADSRCAVAQARNEELEAIGATTL